MQRSPVATGAPLWSLHSDESGRYWRDRGPGDTRER